MAVACKSNNRLANPQQLHGNLLCVFRTHFVGPTCAQRMYSRPSAMVKASSMAGVAPASYSRGASKPVLGQTGVGVRRMAGRQQACHRQDPGAPQPTISTQQNPTPTQAPPGRPSWRAAISLCVCLSRPCLRDMQATQPPSKHTCQHTPAVMWCPPPPLMWHQPLPSPGP
jgi:hypothetical protein